MKFPISLCADKIYLIKDPLLILLEILQARNIPETDLLRELENILQHLEITEKTIDGVGYLIGNRKHNRSVFSLAAWENFYC